MIPENGRLALVHVGPFHYSELEKEETIYTENTSIYDLSKLGKVAVSADNGYSVIVCSVASCQIIPDYNVAVYRLELKKSD